MHPGYTVFLHGKPRTMAPQTMATHFSMEIKRAVMTMRAWPDSFAALMPFAIDMSLYFWSTVYIEFGWDLHFSAGTAA